MNKELINKQNANFQSFLTVLDKEGVLNDRILQNIEKISGSSEKIKYCRKIISTKDLFVRLFNKTKVGNFPYDYAYYLKNIDLLSKREVWKKLKDFNKKNKSYQKIKKPDGENGLENNIPILKSPKKKRPKKNIRKKTNQRGYMNTAEENRKRTSLQQNKSKSDPAIFTSTSIRTYPGGLPET